jgi:glutamyl/glutaminyl-tRNA synthetase
VEYEQQGFLPDALLNYLALLGWSPGDNREVLTREELTQLFGLERVRKSAAQFDLEKLTWLNSEHARALPLEEAVAGVVPFLEVAGLWPAEGRDADWLVELIQTVEFGNRCKTFAEFPAEADFFLVDTFEYQPKSVKKVLRKAGAEEILREVFGLLQELVEWGAEALEALLRQVSERREVGFGKVAQPLRVALSGRHTTPGITETMQLLGRDRSLARIERCLQEIYGNTGESGQ